MKASKLNDDNKDDDNKSKKELNLMWETDKAKWKVWK
jgi:hypothetical protein